MRGIVAAFALFMLAFAAGGAFAQERSAFAPWSRALFVSPMGEAFRASDGRHGVDLWFAGADTDHDGKMSHEEYLADATRYFDRLDANQDNSATSASDDLFSDPVTP